MSKPRILLGSDKAPAWRQGIRESAVFFLLLSPNALRSPRIWEHITYAKSLGKPFRVAVIEGAEVPEGFLDGIADLEIRRCASVKEVELFLHEAAWQPPLEPES